MSPAHQISGKLVAGLFEKGLAGAVTPELEAHLASEGIELRNLKQSYPYAAWVRGLEVTASELYGGEVLSDALRKLGARVVYTLREQGVVKGPMITMGRLMGPQRVLKQIHNKPVRGADFLRIEVVDKGKHHLELHFNDGAIGDFIAGGLEAVVELLGGHQPQVQPQVTTPERCILDVVWR
ncbi:MAG: hypothetical protein H6Q89_4212 [Myxococcaceae bacterium]|nr:hypothetical protein [Myxococcaceae bacterium]